jgi:PadR family transcriptional regulator PadR
MEPQQRDWRRSLIRPLSLAIVRQSGPIHGYDIATRLEEAGIGSVPGGTLYPILRRLEDDGFLQSDWAAGDGGPGRKMYSITALGMGELKEFASTWSALVQSLHQLTKEAS